MFWDSSAVVTLLIAESRSPETVALLRADPVPGIWWTSPLECQSALHRRQREGILSPSELGEALVRLRRLAADFDVVAPSVGLRDQAGLVLARHALRAADALQLAAALLWAEQAPSGEGFVCLDDRLREAARHEGFDVRPERL